MGVDIEKKIKSLEGRVAIIQGEAHALKVVVGSFIAISPSYEQMLESFDAVEDVVESRVLPAGVPEEFLVGARRVLAEIRTALESRKEN